MPNSCWAKPITNACAALHKQTRYRAYATTAQAKRTQARYHACAALHKQARYRACATTSQAKPTTTPVPPLHKQNPLPRQSYHEDCPLAYNLTLT